MELICMSTLLPLALLGGLLSPPRTQPQDLLMAAARSSQSQQATPQSQATPAPQREDKPEANSLIESNLKSAFSGDPMLNGASIDTHVDDSAITLSGSVQSEGQHQRALQLAAQFGQYRKIVDKIAVK